VKKLLSFFLLLGLISCDDGDIIVTSFEFDDVDLQLCEGAKANEFVFFKINSSVNEAISYNFISPEYSDTSVTNEDGIKINLEDDNNSLVYRQFNTNISADYYCNNIPDANIIITQELKSTSGEATIINQIVSEDDNDGVEDILESPNDMDPEADLDNDGVPNYLDDAIDDPAIGNENGEIEAGYNTDKDDDDGTMNDDGDDIPDFKDQDDDNDNILTSAELTDPDSNDFLDTDNDGIPNYKDNDDDGDGILTRDEDINGNGNPRDDDTDNDGIPNYLDSEESAIVANPSILDNTVITIFRTTLSINNLKLDEDSALEEFEDEQFSFGFRDRMISITTPKE